jgi:hypothetical protein
MDRFAIEPVLSSVLPEVADFLRTWSRGGVSVLSIERRLRWLLLENPVAGQDPTLGYSLRDSEGVLRGLSLQFPVAYAYGDKRILGLCSGSYFVEEPARSLGFYLFKKFLRTSGYSFYFASTCNASSSALWKTMGGCAVPNSETEFFLPLKLDAVMSSFVAGRTSSQVAAGIARVCGYGVNPILRFLNRSVAKFTIQPCHDWEKLAELSRRHRSPDYITSDRSPAFLEWRYGPGSPAHPCNVYLFQDESGHEGWFALGDLSRGDAGKFRESVLLDLIWPREHMSCESIFPEIVRVAADSADAITFRWQPGLDYREFSRCVIPHKLPAPRAFVAVPKGSPRFSLQSLDYDDSDFIAWRFKWTNA